MGVSQSERESGTSPGDETRIGYLAYPRRAPAVGTRFSFEPLLPRVLSIVGTIAVLVSIAEALRNAVQNSMDFQWSGAHLLLLHRDPWAVYLSGNPNHQIILVQIPNYLHELYVLLLPLGSVAFGPASVLWAISNIFFVLVLAWYASRLCELNHRKTWILFFLVLTSTPFRVTVGNGQNGALALAAIALWAVVRSENRRGLLLGVAYEKYSFFPVLVLFLLMRCRWRLIACSLVPPILGFLFVKVWLGTGWGTLALEPFLTAVHKGNVTPGLSNIVAIALNLLSHVANPSPWLAVVPYVLAILLACVFAGYFSRKASGTDGRILLACLLTASLVSVPHQIYDFLALVFPLAVALRSQPSRPRTIVLWLVVYFWYFERLLAIRHWHTNPYVVLLSFVLALWLIAATYQLRTTAAWTARWEI